MMRLDALLAWYGTLTPATLARIDEFYHPQARFKDPFNDVQGIAAIRRIFEHMFANTTAPRFIIREELGDAHRAFVTWDFVFGMSGRGFAVHGATRFGFDAAGLVTEHRDYWDPAEELWQKLPVLGTPVAWLRRRMQAG